jgi:hypothetical protein
MTYKLPFNLIKDKDNIIYGKPNTARIAIAKLLLKQFIRTLFFKYKPENLAYIYSAEYLREFANLILEFPSIYVYLNNINNIKLGCSLSFMVEAQTKAELMDGSFFVFDLTGQPSMPEDCITYMLNRYKGTVLLILDEDQLVKFEQYSSLTIHTENVSTVDSLMVQITTTSPGLPSKAIITITPDQFGVGEILNEKSS